MQHSVIAAARVDTKHNAEVVFTTVARHSVQGGKRITFGNSPA
jgi:hypothetical protein